MTSNLSTIQPHVDFILKKLAVLPTLALDTTSNVSQFVQKLLSNQEFFVTALTSGGKPQVVVMNFSIYDKIYTLVNSLPGMFGLIQFHKAIAIGSAHQLAINIICMEAGTVLTIAGVYMTAQIITRENHSDKAYRWKAVALAGISAISYSMMMTYKVARGLQAIA